MRARRQVDSGVDANSERLKQGFRIRRVFAGGLLVGVTGWVAVASSGGPVSVLSIGASAPTSTVASTTTTSGPTSTTSNSTSTTSTTALSAPSTTVGKAPPTTVTVPIPDPAAIEAAAQRFCALSAGYLEQVRQIEISMTSPDRLRQLLQAAAPAAAESATLAVKEVQPDVTKVSGALGELRAALEAADYQLAKLPPDMVVKLQSTPVRDAINHVEQFTGKAC
jgi:hypothetical protein